MYDLGDDAYLTMSFTDATGAFVNVSGLTVTVALPDETTTAPVTPTNDTVGHYHYSYPTVQVGKHTANWVGTNPKVTQTQVFNVEPAVDISLVALTDVKTQLNITATTFDEELRGFILSASENIERTCGTCTPRTFTEKCDGDWAFTVSRIPVLSVTSLASVYQWNPAIVPADLIVNLDTGTLQRANGWEFWGPYNVTYKAGRHVIPSSLRTACMLIVQYLWMTRRGPQASQTPGGLETVQPQGWPYEIPVRAAGLMFTFPGAPGFA